MSRRPAGTPARLPFTKEEVMDELREVLLANACQITLSTGSDELTTTYIGFDPMDFDLSPVNGPNRDAIAKVDLGRFWITQQIGLAFDYAFQTGDTAARTAFGMDDWTDITIFREGAARCGFGGETTPLTSEDSRLSHTLDMAIARKKLDHGNSLTIRELALLANMGETAVRTSLSAEGIRTEGKPAQLPADLATEWLRRRRGFVPTLAPEESWQVPRPSSADLLRTEPFAAALQAMMAELGLDATRLAQVAEVDAAWLDMLITGQDDAACDLDALQRLGVSVGADVPLFVGRAVEAILRGDSGS